MGCVHQSWVFLLVKKSLEGVEVSSVFGYQSSRVTSWMIQLWHVYPLILKNVEFFTIRNHLAIFILPTDYVNIPITEVIVCSKGTPALTNAWKFFDRIIHQMILEDVPDDLVMFYGIPVIRLFKHLRSWDDNHSVVREVYCSAESKSFIETLRCYKWLIFWEYTLPVRAACDTWTKGLINEASAGILKEMALFFCVLLVLNRTKVYKTGYDFVIKFSGKLLKRYCFFLCEEHEYFMIDILWFAYE